MPLVKDGCFPSDRVEMLIGFDGSEPKALRAWHQQRQTTFPFRIAFAITQYYPELASGFYRNKRLIALVQEVLRDAGLSVVLADNHRLEGIVPVEWDGSLEEADEYVLVTETLRIQGCLKIWESLGGTGRFYHDNLIMEIAIAEMQPAEIAKSFEKRCHAAKVSCAIISGTPTC